MDVDIQVCEELVLVCVSIPVCVCVRERNTGICGFSHSSTYWLPCLWALTFLYIWGGGGGGGTCICGDNISLCVGTSVGVLCY